MIELREIGQHRVGAEMLGMALKTIRGVRDFAMQRFSPADVRANFLVTIQAASFHPFAAPRGCMACRAIIRQLRMRTNAAEFHLASKFLREATLVQCSGAKDRASPPRINRGHYQQRAGAEQKSQR